MAVNLFFMSRSRCLEIRSWQLWPSFGYRGAMPSSTLGQSCLTLFELVIALVATHQAWVCIQFPSQQHHVVFGIVKDFANLLLCPFLVFLSFSTPNSRVSVSSHFFKSADWTLFLSTLFCTRGDVGVFSFILQAGTTVPTNCKFVHFIQCMLSSIQAGLCATVGLCVSLQRQIYPVVVSETTATCLFSKPWAAHPPVCRSVDLPASCQSANTRPSIRSKTCQNIGSKENQQLPFPPLNSVDVQCVLRIGRGHSTTRTEGLLVCRGSTHRVDGSISLLLKATPRQVPPEKEV